METLISIVLVGVVNSNTSQNTYTNTYMYMYMHIHVTGCKLFMFIHVHVHVHVCTILYCVVLLLFNTYILNSKLDLVMLCQLVLLKKMQPLNTILCMCENVHVHVYIYTCILHVHCMYFDRTMTVFQNLQPFSC